MATSAVDLRHWTREEYERLVNEGFFQPGERLELVDGVIYERPPQSSFHATVVYLFHEALRAIFTPGYFIRSQMPLALADDSEPEPDLAVIQGDPLDFADAHPRTAALVVEVADSSLHHDRERKKKLYARAGIPEYWLAHRAKRTLEVYRNPEGDNYRSRQVLGPRDTVSPLACARGVIILARVFPQS